MRNSSSLILPNRNQIYIFADYNKQQKGLSSKFVLKGSNGSLAISRRNQREKLGRIGASLENIARKAGPTDRSLSRKFKLKKNQKKRYRGSNLDPTKSKKNPKRSFVISRQVSRFKILPRKNIAKPPINKKPRSRSHKLKRLASARDISLKKKEEKQLNEKSKISKENFSITKPPIAKPMPKKSSKFFEAKKTIKEPDSEKKPIKDNPIIANKKVPTSPKKKNNSPKTLSKKIEENEVVQEIVDDEEERDKVEPLAQNSFKSKTNMSAKIRKLRSLSIFKKKNVVRPVTPVCNNEQNRIFRILDLLNHPDTADLFRRLYHDDVKISAEISRLKRVARQCAIKDKEKK